MLDGFTYFRMNAKSRNYHCSKSWSGCKGQVKFNKQGDFIKINTDHKHERPNFIVTKSDCFYKFIPITSKKSLLMYRGYTFSKNNHAKYTFYCSKRYCNCNAKVKLDSGGRIDFVSDVHNHAPPKYVIDVNGMYLKVSS